MIVVALLALPFALYATSLHGEFLFDDHTGFLNDPRVIDGRWRECVTLRELRWLTMVSYALNVRYLGRLYR